MKSHYFYLPQQDFNSSVNILNTDDTDCKRPPHLNREWHWLIDIVILTVK